MTLRLQDLTVITGPHELVSLARFDTLRVSQQQLVPGGPPSVTVVGVTESREGEETAILAWFPSAENAQRALSLAVQAILEGNPTIDWTGGTRPAHPLELQALEQAQAAARSMASMSPEDLARYTAARQQQQPQPSGWPEPASQPARQEPQGFQQQQQPQPQQQQSQAEQPGGLPQPAAGQQWRPVPRIQVQRPGQGGQR